MMLFYQGEKVRFYQDDVLAWALDYKAQIDADEVLPFHAIVTDPPYSLGATPPIGKLLTAWMNDDDIELSRGFMGAIWDVMPSPKYWRALLDVCYPGAYLFAFSSTRTADLLGISCRLGGWEPFDRVTNFQWVYGSGFPKSHNVSIALDKDARAEREVVGRQKALGNARGKGAAGHCANNIPSMTGEGYEIVKDGWDITAPATPLAQAFSGYGSALKPAGEPILLFRKPREGQTFAECAREFGSSGLNVGACRVKSGVLTYTSTGVVGAGRERACNLYNRGDGKTPDGRDCQKAKDRQQKYKDNAFETSVSGRWPPNVHFTHVPPHACPACEGDGWKITSSVPMSLCPDCMADEGGWWIPDAPDKCPDCGADTTERMMHNNKLPCPECLGEGVVGGCVRVGTRKVKAITGGGGLKTSDKNTVNCYGKYADRELPSVIGYAGSDGKETVADWRCVEGCPVRALGEMSGERKTGALRPHYNLSKDEAGCKTGALYGRYKRQSENREPSVGSAARFFPNHDWSYEIAERLAGETPFFYTAKASRGERDAGLETVHEKDTVLGNGLNSATKVRTEKQAKNGVDRGGCGNPHPTVKSLSLTKWLATLCKPPDQFKPRICIPYAGSGSEAIGAILAGWSEIHAIEREQEYCEIAAARIAWWSKWAGLTGKTDPAEIRGLGNAADEREAWQDDERQTSMFEIIE